ncbi:MAG: type II secretion system protein GspD [Halobacteriovoraceae bacterium]|nr:type II secretion system protein GspD [Halobacteriovoraceae bacterium]
MKRVTWKNSTKNILAITIILQMTTPIGFAQFKDFKSKSRFNTNKNDSQKNQNFSDDDNNKKAFGKRTQKLPPMPDSKYVNLNLETAFGPEIVKTFDFPDSDIMELTKFMQELTGINLILDKDVKGKVSITAPTPITVGDAWKAYLAALNMAGFTLVQSGAFYKIINARDVRYVPTKIYTGSYTPDTESHIMKIMALKNVDAAEISRNFRPFMSRYGRIIDIKQTNTIIISDTGANIARLEKLIKFLDVPGHEESLQIIPVKNSSAQEIAKLLDEILQGGGSSSSRRTVRRSKRFSKSSSSSTGSQNISKIIAEPRTNSIIAMANSAGAQELRSLIKKLDVKFSSNQADKIHVHYLNYGNAEELAKTLSNLVSGAQASGNARSSNNNRRSFISRGNEGSTLFNGEVKITADKNNNALVVTAAPTDWLTMKNVIAKLDIPRDQVYVEGLIMETSVTKVRGFGVEFVGAYGQGNAQRGGFTNNNGIFDLLSGNPTNLSGFFAGIGGPEKGSRTVKIGENELKINSVNALIRAIASNSNTNVLATPQILAMDNTDAEFEVGATVPVKQQNTNANGTTSETFDKQEAKLSLKITPQINKATRFVKLKINQSINDFVGELDTSGNGQATTTRSAVTEVMVRDRDTVAMGGLLRDRETVSFNKVPLLGDIPVLGWLFKSKQRRVDKVNLLFFLTPRIISPYDNQAAANSLKALEDRADNLKNIIDEENPDPHKNMTDRLVKKIQKQKEGPLFDNSDNKYLQTNEEVEGIGPTEDVPNYKEIEAEINKNKTN